MSVKKVFFGGLVLLIVSGSLFASGQNQSGGRASLVDTYKKVSNDGATTVSADDFPIGELKGKYTIALAMGTMGSGFFRALPNAARAELEKYGVRVVEADARQNIATQVSQIEDFLAQGVDGIIINPVDPPSAVSVVLEKAAAQGVPVVSVDSLLDADFHNYLGMIGSDNHRLGYVLGEYAAKELVKRYGSAQGTLATLDGVAGNAVANLAYQGFWDGVKSVDPNNKLVEITRLWGGSWTEEAGIQMAEDMMVAHPKIDVMFGISDAFVIGSSAAAARVGRNEMIMVGRDGSKAALKILNDGGLIKAVSMQDPLGVGRAGARLMLSFLTTGYLPKTRTMMLDPALATPENIKEKYNPDALF
jgi:ribose transport system substrate-binding protein